MACAAYHRVSAVVFAFVALMHAARALQQTPVLVGSTSVPVWLSWLAVVVAGSLAAWGLRSRG